MPDRLLHLGRLFALILPLINLTAHAVDQIASPDYSKHIAPLLRKYCGACHNDDDREGKLVLNSYSGILKGGENGAVITTKRGDLSRMIRVLTGQAKPAMPPDDSAKPSKDEIDLLIRWIDAGAKGPEGKEPDPSILITPTIKPTVEPRAAVNAIAVSPRGDAWAVARYRHVELYRGGKVTNLRGHRGNVNDVSFSRDGKWLVAAAGEAGLFGEVRLWDVANGKQVKVIQGHRDSLYAAELSPNGKILATASYDRDVRLWDVDSGKELKTLSGHNGAVYGVAFHPDGKLVATASDDRTVKLWNIETGERLDTLGQSTKELYSLAFAPSGKRLAAAGVDNRIRVWQISDSGTEGTNPLLYSRFAHEAPVLRLVYSSDGRTLLSSGEDRRIKVWNAQSMTLRSTFGQQSDWVTGLAITPDNKQLFAGRLDGSFDRLSLKTGKIEDAASASRISEANVSPSDKTITISQLPKTSEAEPNDLATQATKLSVPTVASGRIQNETGTAIDVDLFAISVKAGQPWIIETSAARSKSPVDTKIEVLHEDGLPVERLLLRAVRDSEITFRGINSEQLNCRVTHWEEMELNQLLYMSGEIVKLYRAPRGPDSGFNFYPNTGKRYCYFDSSARSHALDDSCYIVEPFAPGSTFPENGLPVFPVNYENDDESRHQLGKDSRVTFRAPFDGRFLIRVCDVRGFAGEDFKYDLIVRRPAPDFKVTLHGANPTVNAGSGKEFRVQVERIDGFDGPIQIKIDGLPKGFTATMPLIQAGHIEGWGVINAHANAPKPTEENWGKTQVTATAEIANREITRDVNNFGTVKLAARPKLVAHLALLKSQADEKSEKTTNDADLQFREIPQLVITAGESIRCRLRIERHEFKGRVAFDVNNLPHGVIVDDIGLSGVLIPEGKTERTIFLKAATWVPETSRLFHAVAKVEGNQVTLPMMLHVQPAHPGSHAPRGNPGP